MRQPHLLSEDELLEMVCLLYKQSNVNWKISKCRDILRKVTIF